MKSAEITARVTRPGKLPEERAGGLSDDSASWSPRLRAFPARGWFKGNRRLGEPGHTQDHRLALLTGEPRFCLCHDSQTRG